MKKRNIKKPVTIKLKSNEKKRLKKLLNKGSAKARLIIFLKGGE